MPPELRKLALVYLFQWYGMVCYWQFVALSIAKSVFRRDRRKARYGDAVAWTGLVNGWYNIVTFLRRLLAGGVRPEARRQVGALRLPAAARPSG